MLYRFDLRGEKRNKSMGSGECSSLEKLCVCKTQAANENNFNGFFLLMQEKEDKKKSFKVRNLES